MPKEIDENTEGIAVAIAILAHSRDADSSAFYCRRARL